MSYNIRKIIAYMQQYSPKSEYRPVFHFVILSKSPFQNSMISELPVSSSLRFDSQRVDHLHADMERGTIVLF